MVDRQVTQDFPKEWIEAWNRGELERVLAHFSDDFDVWAPAIYQVTGESRGVLRGKAALAAHWERIRKLIPDVRFELVSTLATAAGITVYYKGVGGKLAAETFYFDGNCKICKVISMLGGFLSIGRRYEKQAS